VDKTLERILSLLPKKPDGKILHGARTEFAKSIGYADGHIFSMWESGSSDSYKKKLHEIAAKYGVSVEWLRGETDEKSPPRNQGGQMTPEERARQERLQLLVKLFENLSPAEQERFLGRLEGIALSREDRGNP
jgi:hypothetical protein